VTRAEGLRARELARWDEALDERPLDERGAQQAALAFLARRAELLHALLQTRFPAVGSALRIAGSGRLLPALALPAALALGLAAEELGPDQHVNLLSAPILGLLAWNLLVYALLLAGALVRARPRVPGALAALATWLAAPERPWTRTRACTPRARASRCTSRRWPSPPARSAGSTCAAWRSSTRPAGRARSSTPRACGACSRSCSGRPRR
jgi:hypothetical protein